MAKAGGRRRPNGARVRQQQSSPAPEPASRSDQGPAPSRQDLVAAAIGAAVQAVCDGSADAHGRHLDPLAIEREPGWTEAVSRALAGYLRASVSAAWQRGWQPAELARHFGRELSADHAAMVADMIAAEMLGYAGATVDARWAAQVGRARGGRARAGAPGGGATRSTSAPGTRSAAMPSSSPSSPPRSRRCTSSSICRPWRSCSRCPAPPGRSPRQTRPPQPGRPPAPRPRLAPADERMLSRIRALLAKAESTEFARGGGGPVGPRAGADGQVQHRPRAAGGAGRERAETPGGRRIAVDNPYEAAEGDPAADRRGGQPLPRRLVQGVGLVTVIGFPADLDAVELLFTSLLVQANTAMLRTGGKREELRAVQDAGVPPVVPALLRDPNRRAAVGGDRARRAGGGGGAAGRERRPRAPPTARRREEGRRPGAVPRGAPRAVDDAVDGHVRFHADHEPRRSGRPTPEGWDSGRAAADLASLRNQAQVVG